MATRRNKKSPQATDKAQVQPNGTAPAPAESCPPDDWLLPGGKRPRCCARHQGQYDAYAAAVHMQAPCLLCHAPQEIRGVFYPTDPVLWGGNMTQHRVIFYSLCLECFARTDSTDAVEKHLYATLTHGDPHA